MAVGDALSPPGPCTRRNAPRARPQPQRPARTIPPGRGAAFDSEVGASRRGDRLSAEGAGRAQPRRPVGAASCAIGHVGACWAEVGSGRVVAFGVVLEGARAVFAHQANQQGVALFTADAEHQGRLAILVARPIRDGPIHGTLQRDARWRAAGLGEIIRSLAVARASRVVVIGAGEARATAAGSLAQSGQRLSASIIVAARGGQREAEGEYEEVS
jgi:hypothetical protein